LEYVPRPYYEDEGKGKEKHARKGFYDRCILKSDRQETQLAVLRTEESPIYTTQEEAVLLES